MIFLRKEKIINKITFLIIILLVIPISIAYEIDNNKNSKTNYDSIIEIDINKTNGFIKNFGHINCGPHPIFGIENGADISNQYREIGVEFVRTHDFYGPTDISTIFPDFNEDPNNESSYNFELSDQVINSIIDGGFKVFYRLGESASGNITLRQPPGNYSKWAEICKHIIMHYNDGWNNGYFFNILYWEIWNEPDLIGFWNSSSYEYYQLYDVTSTILKDYNPSLKIGGPCTSSVFNDEFTHDFISYIKENQLSLDFFSWHMYANSPVELYGASIYVRKLLDEYGFYNCENINTEWNINILTPQRDKDNANNAAFTSSSLIRFQDAKLNFSFRYRGTQDNNWLGRLIGFDLSLFNYNGTYKTPALSYLAHYILIKDTPIRLYTALMNDSIKYPYLAGLSDDKSNISFIISNYDNEKRDFNLKFVNLPWETEFNIVHYVIDDTKHFEVANQVKSKDSILNYNLTIEQSSVHFLRLSNASIFPEEGPNVAEIPLFLRLKILDPLTRILGIILLIIAFG